VDVQNNSLASLFLRGGRSPEHARHPHLEGRQGLILSGVVMVLRILKQLYEYKIWKAIVYFNKKVLFLIHQTVRLLCLPGNGV